MAPGPLGPALACSGLTSPQQHPEADSETRFRADELGQEWPRVSEIGHMVSVHPPVTALGQKQRKEQGTEGQRREKGMEPGPPGSSSSLLCT